MGAHSADENQDTYRVNLIKAHARHALEKITVDQHRDPVLVTEHEKFWTVLRSGDDSSRDQDVLLEVGDEGEFLEIPQVIFKTRP